MSLLSFTRPVGIRRYKIPGADHASWYVSCSICVGDGFDGLLATLQRPVVMAARHEDAIWWANWHAREHDLTRCPCCSHQPAVPIVTVLDRDTVKVGERLFVRASVGGWQEVAA